MKSMSTLLNSLIFAGLAFGVAGSTFAGQGPAVQPQAIASAAASTLNQATEQITPAQAIEAANKTIETLNSAAQAPASSNTSILSYLGKGLWFAATHPKVTVPALGLSGLLYLYYTRLNGKNWTPELNEAKCETRYLDATAKSPATPRTKYRYWLLARGSAQELAKDYKSTYNELRNLFPKKGDKQEFINQTMRDIDAEKKKLELISNKLNQIIAESTFLPRIFNYDPNVDNPVQVIIDNYLKEQKNPLYLLKTKDQFEALNKKINAIVNFSLSSLFNTRPWKTFNWHRLYALQYEADAMEQYWKVYQMIAHLDALQYCLLTALTDKNLE
jgi:hypothetical protein